MLTLDLVAVIVFGVLIVALASYLVNLAHGIKKEVVGLKSSTGADRMNLLEGMKQENQQLKALIVDEASKAEAQVKLQISQLDQANHEANEAVSIRLDQHEQGVLAALDSLSKAHADIRDAYADMKGSHAELLGNLQSEITGLNQRLTALGSRVSESYEVPQPTAEPERSVSEARTDGVSSTAVISPAMKAPVVAEAAAETVSGTAAGTTAEIKAIAEVDSATKVGTTHESESVAGVDTAVATAPRAEAQEPASRVTAKRIVSWDELPAAVQKQWLDRITKLTLPPVSYDAEEEELSPKDLVNRIKQDPVLCAKILAVANSAAQGQIQPVTSIERAAVQLGTNMLRIIISAYHLEAIFGHYPNYSKEHFAFVQRWSCAASVFAYHLAAHGDSTDRHMLSTAALVSRLGCLILGVIEHGPDGSYRDIQFETERSGYEIERWKVTTPLLSERLARHWGLPDPLPSLLCLQERPLVEVLERDSEALNLLILCLSSVIVAAYLNDGADAPIAILSDDHYAMLAKNTAAHNLDEAVYETWNSKAMQRELMSIIEVSGGQGHG